MLERWFKLKEHGTTVGVEVVGGMTTFFAMAYIIVVNPSILAFAGVPVGPSTVATILAAVIATTLMAFLAKRPIAGAPYMGENAFMAFGLAALGIAWETRLGALFIAGLAFIALTLFRARAWLANGISKSLKYAFAVGIGLFLTLIGLYETGIVVSFVSGAEAASLTDAQTGLLRNPNVPLKIGDFRDPKVLLAIAGFVLIAALMARRVKGAILIGMAATAVVGIALGYALTPNAIFAMPFVGKYDLGEIALKMDLAGVLQVSMIPIVLTLFLMTFLDTLGTLVGVGAAGGFLDKEGNFRDIEKPMLADAIATTISPVLGTSTTGAYIESAAGIEEGARTGLAALVTAGLFAISLFFIPLFEPMQGLAFAYGPALIVVGLLMTRFCVYIDFTDLTEAVPAFATILLTVFTYNIANGLVAGLLLYPVMKLLAGKAREIHPAQIVLAVIGALYFVSGVVH